MKTIRKTSPVLATVSPAAQAWRAYDMAMKSGTSTARCVELYRAWQAVRKVGGVEMISVIQMFHGEEKRIVGRARTSSGIARLLRSVEGASDGWGVKLRGTTGDFKNIGQDPDVFFEYRSRGQDRLARCEVI